MLHFTWVLCLLLTKPQSDFAVTWNVTQCITLCWQSNELHSSRTQIFFQDTYLPTWMNCWDCYLAGYCTCAKALIRHKYMCIFLLHESSWHHFLWHHWQIIINTPNDNQSAMKAITNILLSQVKSSVTHIPNFWPKSKCSLYMCKYGTS
jgi:hypothetical protein